MQILQVQRQKLAQPEEIYSVCAFFQQCQWLFCIYVDNEDNSMFVMKLARTLEFLRVLISFLPSCWCVECWVGLPAQTSDPFTSPWSFCPRRDSWGAENSRHQFLCNAACQHFGPDDQHDEEDWDKYGFRRIQRWPGPTSDWWEEAGQPAAGSDLDRLQGSGARWEWVPGIVHTLATTWPVHSQLQPGQLDPWTLDLGPAWG